MRWFRLAILLLRKVIFTFITIFLINLSTFDIRINVRMFVIIFKIEVFVHRPVYEFVEEHDSSAVGVDFLERGLCVGDLDAPARERRDCLSELVEPESPVAWLVQLYKHFPLLEVLAQLAQEHSEFSELYLVRADLAAALGRIFCSIERSDDRRLRVEHLFDSEHIPDALVDFRER